MDCVEYDQTIVKSKHDKKEKTTKQIQVKTD